MATQKTTALPELVAWPGRDRKTGRRIWAVLSRSRTQKNDYPTFHLVWFDYRSGKWQCPCESRKECVHIMAAIAANRTEKEREFAKDEVRRATYATRRVQPMAPTVAQ